MLDMFEMLCPPRPLGQDSTCSKHSKCPNCCGFPCNLIISNISNLGPIERVRNVRMLGPSGKPSNSHIWDRARIRSVQNVHMVATLQQRELGEYVGSGPWGGNTLRIFRRCFESGAALKSSTCSNCWDLQQVEYAESGPDSRSSTCSKSAKCCDSACGPGFKKCPKCARCLNLPHHLEHYEQCNSGSGLTEPAPPVTHSRRPPV